MAMVHEVHPPQPQPQTARPRSRRIHSILRNRPLVIGAVLVAIVLLAAIFAPWLVPFQPNAPDYYHLNSGPSALHWFGTDNLGRDEFARILIGDRTSMLVSAGSLIVGLLVGVPIGLISGFYRGFVDDWFIMRIMDALQAFPFLILALVLAAMLGPGLGNAMIAIGIGYIPIFVRIVRGQVLAELEKEYISAALTVGASNFRIMWRHILPNILSPLIVQITLAMASGIVAEASLSYLGLGVQPPTASWGTMLHDAQGYLGIAPWLAIVPGLAIGFAVLGFNVLGDGLQRWLDPRQRH